MKPTLRSDPRGPLRIWSLPDPNRAYSIGADVGGGKSSSDFCAASVVARDNGEQCATFQAHMDAMDFAEVIFLLGVFFGGREPMAFLVLEINAHGLAVLEKLKMLGYSNIYMRRTWDAIEKQFQLVLGWQTSVKSRPILINRGRTALADPSVTIRDPELFKEMSTFVFTDSGREDHLEGSNDDILFSWMLSHEGRAVQIENNPSEVVTSPGLIALDERSQRAWDRVHADQDAAMIGGVAPRSVYTGAEDDGWYVE